ncbi:MAG: hypothetical protein MJ057_06595 [Sphaerochaetaceae bacterium]|nr:hypothetical protein [Sphaerochaetaceae bacterium]
MVKNSRKNYGEFLATEGSYRLTSIPEAGNFEYIYKNRRIFLKVDQFGPSFMQMDPLGGMRILKRMERETFSPWRVVFTVSGHTYSNFDIYSADAFSITYSPNVCEYCLTFGALVVVTHIMVSSTNAEAFMTVTFHNKSQSPVAVHALEYVAFDPVDSKMEVWDKKEWLSKISASKAPGYSSFLLHHVSLQAKPEDRRDFHFICSGNAAAQVTSYEKLRHYTKNFSVVDSSQVAEPKDNYSYEEVCASYYDFELKDTYCLKSLIYAGMEHETAPESLICHLNDEYLAENGKKLKDADQKLCSVKRIHTADRNFDSFVNTFLPKELSWVMDLDRGWASGMRGSRDCSNDFMGYLSYDPKACRAVLARLLESQRRSDGWFPRQIPFGSEKYDMREFVDSACFVMEFLYEYLAYTDDYSILEQKFGYLKEPLVLESGLEHMVRAVLYYTKAENIGEHGLVKLRGGDWLDSLSCVGKLGRAETLMVTAQALLAFDQVLEILHHLGRSDLDEVLETQSKAFRSAIRVCRNEEGYYNALFTDKGQWLLSSHDVDGHSRAYIPANAYAIIAGVDPEHDDAVIEKLKEKNRTPIGYNLIDPPFGDPTFEGLGKLSSGDYFPYHLCNGAVYNHGSQMFLLRALAKVGDHELFQEVLDFALPYNQDVHPECDTCLPMYAITNSYTSVPSFPGRAGFAFLTGTIAMIERAVYNWMFGLDFRCSSLKLKPCLPKRFSDSEVTIPYGGHKIHVRYVGFGSVVTMCLVKDKEIALQDGCAVVDKAMLTEDTEIVVYMR